MSIPIPKVKEPLPLSDIGIYLQTDDNIKMCHFHATEELRQNKCKILIPILAKSKTQGKTFLIRHLGGASVLKFSQLFVILRTQSFLTVS